MNIVIQKIIHIIQILKKKNTINKYILDDYVENIKKNKFNAGNIEINVCLLF